MIFKKIRYSYWLISAFIKKNLKFISISFICGFFLIIFLINVFPYIESLFFSKKEIIGYIGRRKINELPDEITAQISNPLISINARGDILPVLSSTYESLNKGKTYRFHIKNNLFWSDSQPLIAKDIKYQLKNTKIKSVDDYTLDFILSEPLVIFPNYLTKPIIKYPLLGVGGNYQVKHIKLKENYLTQLSLIPYSQNLPFKTYKFFPNEDELINAYKKGEINQFVTTKKTIADYFQNWKNTIVKKNEDYDKIMVIFINHEKELFQNKDIRKSIAYSMPAFSEYGIKAYGSIPPSSWSYDNTVKTYNYNLEKAKNLLDKNLTASSSGSLVLSTFFDFANIADIIKNQLETTGYKVNIKLVSGIPKNYDLLLTIWSPGIDPDQYYMWHSSQIPTQTNPNLANITRFNSIKIDKLLEQGRQIINAKQRKTIYKEFETALIDEVPAIFLYYPAKYTIKRL